ncbi:DUF192 domain-containing protein [Tabrizicola sp. KVB23]|uniref:DUF192 domain-containing protein n=2 Tax=Fuscibacter oryzae TaxID=2803939 RepID=A0A8J7MTB1_9RHOB|nr:DUF192 domain-containing protein [Fuscibacter oryzae]
MTGLMVLAGQAGAECSPDRVDLKGAGGAARFTVEIADRPDLQSKGLMFREKMSLSAGMLFVFPQPKHASFWMRNTLIPLDMIFLDQSGTVTQIHANAVPQDETAIDGGEDVAMVLEINGGLAERMGIAVGSTMRSPFVDQKTALWPCAAP